MIQKLYSIKDEIEGFGPLVPFTNEDAAKRYFRTHLEQTPIMVSTPSDFSIWFLGTYDTNSGTIICTKENIKLIERGGKNGNN